MVLPVEETRASGIASATDVSLPPIASGSDLERSRSRLGTGVARAKGGSTPLRGLSPTYTMQQKEQLTKRLLEELALGRMRSATVAQAS
eukprot:1358716-Alexandrium_andersonii.AAC.1